MKKERKKKKKERKNGSVINNWLCPMKLVGICAQEVWISINNRIIKEVSFVAVVIFIVIVIVIVIVHE